MDELRLDVYLQRCRLIKRRASAREACSAGMILLNGTPARPGKKLKAGDRLELSHGAHLLELEVVVLPVKGDRRVLEGELPYRILSSRPVPRRKEIEVSFQLEGWERDEENGGS